MPNLLAYDQDARRLKDQVVTLAEFIAGRADAFDFAPVQGRAIVHGHCHDRSVMRMKGTEAVFDKLGLDHVVLPDTCCGLAGSFGFEAEHYGVSMAVGEHSLLPAIRAASEDTFILADGFSCREQIAHGTDRRGLHLAELLQMTLHGHPRAGGPPERAALALAPPDLARPPLSAGTKLLAAAAGAAALGGLAWGFIRWARR